MSRHDAFREPEQALAPEVLTALCSWLQATLR